MGKPYVKTVVAWQKSQREKGLCATCTNPSPLHRICSNCRAVKTASTKAKRQQRMAEGKCRECENPKFGSKLFCIEHYLKEVARRHFGNVLFWQELKLKFDQQNGKCALTGDILLPENMELDHITAKSTGGQSIIENLRWVTKDANRAKQSLTDFEFLILCQKVVNTLQ